MSISEQEQKKRLGEEAVQRYVSNGMSIGLGSGTTAIWAVRYIATLCKKGDLKNLVFGATGPGTKLEALSLGLSIMDLNDKAVHSFDIVIDGADEFDSALNLIKGGGGCLLQEKIVAYSSKKFIVLANKSKQVAQFGKSFPIPIEIIPSAYTRVQAYLSSHYDIKSITLRHDAKNIGPWITEEGNYILDIFLNKQYDARTLEMEWIQIVGVVETGIFAGGIMGIKPNILYCESDGSIDVLTE